jgi:hypothetical protein
VLINQKAVLKKSLALGSNGFGNMEDEEDDGSFQNGPRKKKEFMYKKDSDS